MSDLTHGNLSGEMIFANSTSPKGVNCTATNTTTKIAAEAREIGISWDGLTPLNCVIVTPILVKIGDVTLRSTGTIGSTKGSIVATQKRVKPANVPNLASRLQEAQRGIKNVKKLTTPDAATIFPTKSAVILAQMNLNQLLILRSQPKRKKPIKLPGTPETRLSKGFDNPTLASITLPIKVPNAPPNPPTRGP